jgi:hypothetical protein
MTLRTYIKQQKRILHAIDMQCIPDTALDSVMVEPKIWRILHAGMGLLSAAGRIPAHRRLSAYINGRIINAPSQLRNFAEEIVLLHEIGHCMTSEREIEAWAWARRHATRRSKKYVEEMAPRALAGYSQCDSVKDAHEASRYVEL